MPAPKLPPGVHVILGDSAAGIFTRNYGHQNLLIDRDVLNCGPTTRCDTFAAWNAMRVEFWKEVVQDPTLQPRGLNISDDAERLRAAERINLWAATSVSEQLSVAFSVHVVDALSIDPGRLHLLQFESCLGMGELDEAKIAAHPTPTPFTPEMLEDYRAAWAALTSPDPTPLQHFAQARPGASRWLQRALQLMLRRFPDRRDGLPYWDRVILEEVRDLGSKAARVIGGAIGDHWDEGDLVGDIYLFARLLRMGNERLPRPLLAIAGERSGMRSTQVALTPFGREVLEGRASNYPANPIDDWAAGVRLSSQAGALWFNDGGNLVR